MSGGNWGSAGFLIQENLEQVADFDEDEGYIKKNFPELSKIFIELGEKLFSIIHDLDYDISGDAKIHDKKFFEVCALRILKEIFKDVK